jgi:hypothetical protein
MDTYQYDFSNRLEGGLWRKGFFQLLMDNQDKKILPREGLMQYVQGTFNLSANPGPDRRDRGLSPKVFVRNLLTISPMLVIIIIARKIYCINVNACLPLPCQHLSEGITEIVGKPILSIGFLDIDKWVGKGCRWTPNILPKSK